MTSSFSPPIARDLTFTLTDADPTEPSELVNLHGCTVQALEMPSTLTSTSLELWGAFEKGDTVLALKDDAGAAITITVAVDTLVAIGAEIQRLLRGVQFLAVKQSSVEAADRTVRIITGPPA